MKPPRPIQIIGGGLAGLTLGIGLRKRDIPVTIQEAGTYPRHRVCGEFINGRGLDSLERLELIQPLLDAGAVEARTARFFLDAIASPVRELPRPALCISRYVLDHRLASIFRDLGGDLQTGSRSREREPLEGAVRASGRRLRAVEHNWRWFGLKVHTRHVELTTDLEMHAQESGYVGLCRLGSGEVNVCGIFRRRSGAADREDWRDLLRGNPRSPLRERLANAAFQEETFCSVAGLSLRPRSARHLGECCIGDALTMTPPVTGNGMSMAFEAAEIALDPLSRYSAGELNWSDACRQIARESDWAFQSRLRWARLLQWLMLTQLSRGWPGTALLNSKTAWNCLYHLTR